MTVHVVDDDPESVRDPYASAGYGRAVAHASGGEWVCIGDVNGDWRLALVLVDQLQAREAVTPYGYAGIGMAPHLDEGERGRLWSNSLSLLRGQGVVTVFLRFPPYRPGAAQLASTLPGLEVHHSSDTVLVPTPSADLVWMGMAGRARTAIRKAESSGFVGEVNVADSMIAAAGSEFRRLYDPTMERLSAPGHLRFDEMYYEQLVRALGSDLLIATVRSGSEIVAACLLISESDVLHYHLSGSKPEAAKLGANNLLLWTALRAASNGTHNAMHLGGGTHKNDSLFHFKTSFGGNVVPFHVGRAIVDRERYAALVDARARELGVAPRALTDCDYFPAFRAVPRMPVRP